MISKEISKEDNLRKTEERRALENWKKIYDFYREKANELIANRNYYATARADWYCALIGLSEIGEFENQSRYRIAQFLGKTNNTNHKKIEEDLISDGFIDTNKRILK